MQSPPTPSDAPLHVLTDASLFRQIVSWTTGWPGLVAYKLLPSLSPDISYWRGRESYPDGRPQGPSTPTLSLLRVADARTLEAAARTRWWNADGQLVGFDFDDAALALKSGNALAARFVFERTERRDVTYEAFYRCWSAAATNCQGRCDVLDVADEFMPRGAFSFSSDFLLRIDHVGVARWFVEQYGPTCLPSNLILAALRKGLVGLYYFLRKTSGQVPTASKVTSLVRDPTKRAICVLVTKCDDRTIQIYGNQLLSLVATSDDTELMEQVLADWSTQCGAAAVRLVSDALARLTKH